ncbi:MAG: corrinoid ABC transporter substrate-binding protein [Methanosaeta sp. PtaU1.Bin112]|nr:MAG: corrinoid ABC transporter substrate-binding protein [Methanosaeta sp. PtaU1.Bin112]
MITKSKRMQILSILIAIVALQASTVASEGYKTINDMRGVQVSIPEDSQRVIAISRGLIDCTMFAFGVQDKLVGGSIYNKDNGYGNYTYDNETHRICPFISFLLNPEYRNLTNVGGFGGPLGVAPNVEVVASLSPDLVIMRDQGIDEENTAKFLDAMERLEIPVVVLKYADCYDNISVGTIYEEIKVLGEIFGKQEKAEEIVDLMNEQVELIRERTQDIADDGRPRVLYFGAPSYAKDRGGAGYAFGTDTIESAFLEDIINAKNAYDGDNTELISAERLLSIDPDVIILPTYSGYHPPSVMYNEEQFGKVQELKAIKDKRVYSLTATPIMDERLEFPINLMIAAKAVYPDRFEDIDLEEWIGNYLKKLYSVDDDKANELKDALLLRYLEIIP